MELNYDWSKYPQVLEFLTKIYFNSIDKLTESEYDRIYVQEFINDIEDYLYYFKIHNYNINNIIYKLQDIEVIEFYSSLIVGDEKNNSNINFPPVINRYTSILLNSNIKGDKRLTSRERRRLYLYQGLSHNLMNMKNLKTMEFSKIFSRYLNFEKNKTETIVNNGWMLIEECLCQELAEKITYFSLDKIRPQYRPGLENEEYPVNGSKISSNLEMYRPFQEITVNFGLTISKIANLYDYSEKAILNDLLKYSINNNLPYLVIAEYNEKDNLLELYQILYLMGLLVNEEYRNYHKSFLYEDSLTEKEGNQIYEMLLELLNRLISFEEEKYINTDISNIKYDKETKAKVLKLVNDRKI